MLLDATTLDTNLSGWPAAVIAVAASVTLGFQVVLQAMTLWQASQAKKAAAMAAANASRAAESAAVSREEVKVTLEQSTLEAREHQNKVQTSQKDTQADVRKVYSLVDGKLRAALENSVAIANRMAERSGLAEDVALAGTATRMLLEHIESEKASKEANP